jgi:WD repeat-containing protein 35
MFLYLSKKIAIPNGINLHSLAWNPDQGWIACGGDSGLLKVLKLELTPSVGPKAIKQAPPAPSNLSMNQTLDGHHGKVICITWNSLYRKLTTSDETGLIIVWMLHKGMWFEEMINNRNKSVVRDMKWTADGTKICIVYEDGAVIVGSVDGNRLWGKELDFPLALVEWSPDSNYILFVSTDATIYAFDAAGNKIKRLILPVLKHPMCVADTKSKNPPKIVAISWYDGAEGASDGNAPSLAVALSNGLVQVSRGTDDLDPIILDTKLDPLTQCKWDTQGSVLALAGMRKDGREVSVVHFYNAHGAFLRTLKVPGGGINALSWEGGGLRIALAVDAYIYFANIRPDYKWAFMPPSGTRALGAAAGGTLCYSFTRPDRTEATVMFWDSATDERNSIGVPGLRYIAAAQEQCSLVSGPDKEGLFQVRLCNSIGSPVDTKFIPSKMVPTILCMTPFHVVVADKRCVYVWQYRNQVLKLTMASEPSSEGLGLKRQGRERVVDIWAVEGASHGTNITEASLIAASTVEAFKYPTQSDSSQEEANVCAVAASEKMLIVCLDNGAIHRYSLPHVSLEDRFQGKGKAVIAKLNCDASVLAIVDNTGSLTLLETGSFKLVPNHEGKEFERKDVWDLCWAGDDRMTLAVMEKTRMHIFENLVPQEPILSSGYLASFNNLEIRAAMLDDVMSAPDRPSTDCVVTFETDRLRKVREIVDAKGCAEAYSHVERLCAETGGNNGSFDQSLDSVQTTHDDKKKTVTKGVPGANRLWQLVAEASLNALELGVADKALVRCGDYRGISLVKALQGMGKNSLKQRAEVCVHLGKFDEAEGIYRDMDRKDLAVDLRVRMGDWFKVLSLIQTGGAGDDKQLQDALTKIGEQYADNLQWGKAARYFSQAKQLPQMATCYYHLQDFESLRKMVRNVPVGALNEEGDSLLLDIAGKLESVGEHEGAIECYLKDNEPRAAIDCAVLMNQWGRAVELSEEFDFPQIEGLLAKKAQQLKAKGDRLGAVELYRKANKSTEAAKLLAGIAEEASSITGDPLRAKKLSVLAALEVERFRKSALNLNTLTGGGDDTIAMATAKTLETLMTMDGNEGTSSSKVLDNAWRGAAAYHYYLLAQRQLHGGKMDDAMKTSIRLAEYEDILEPRIIYSLIALTAYHNKYYGVCSRAFIKLETSPTLSEEDRDVVQTLALQIFTKHSPLDPHPLPHQFIDCLDNGKSYHACTSSGKLIENDGKSGGESRALVCRTCRYSCLERALVDVIHCPLCHAPLDLR